MARLDRLSPLGLRPEGGELRVEFERGFGQAIRAAIGELAGARGA